MPNQTAAQREHTKKIVGKFQTSANDTGSTEVQVAIFTDRIKHLTKHLKANKKDFSTQLGLMRLVGTRRRMLKYLRQREPSRYLKLINELGLRK